MDEELLVSLASTIVMGRMLQVHEQYFEEVTKETFEKWYVAQGRRKTPILNPSLYGGQVYTVEGEYGQALRSFYFMPKKSKWHMQVRYIGKKKKFMPNRPEMKKEIREARALMKAQHVGGAHMYKDGTGKIAVRLTYNTRLPPDYFDKTWRIVYGTDSMYVERLKSTKQSSLDKLLYGCINRWCRDNGIIADVQSTYEV